MQLLEAITLLGAEIIGIAEFRAQLLENATVSLACLEAKGMFEVISQILFDAVVVQQRIVHID